VLTNVKWEVSRIGIGNSRIIRIIKRTETAANLQFMRQFGAAAIGRNIHVTRLRRFLVGRYYLITGGVSFDTAVG
jgi:hypothetical protein